MPVWGKRHSVMGRESNGENPSSHHYYWIRAGGVPSRVGTVVCRALVEAQCNPTLAYIRVAVPPHEATNRL